MTEVKVGDHVRLLGPSWEKDYDEYSSGSVVQVTEISHSGAIWTEEVGTVGQDWKLYDSDSVDYPGYAVELVTKPEVPFEHTPVSPQHYKFPGGEEVISISQWLTSNTGQALQYIARSSRIDGKNKGNAVEDIQKAIKFLTFELERLK